MILYLVKGSATMGEYGDVVEVIGGLEEKPKSYVGQGRKINKDKINKLEEGMFYGSYNIHLIDKSLVEEARMRIRDRVLQYHQTIVEKHTKSVDSVKSFDIRSPIEYRDDRYWI